MPDVAVDPRIAAVQITMRSRLLYRGPVTGVVDGRTTSRDRDPATAPRRHSRRDLRAADASTALPVRHARARHAAPDDRLQGLRRCAVAGRARVPRLPVGAVLERVHRADGARGAPVPALRGTADDSDGRPAHREGAPHPAPVSPKRLSWPVATSITSGYGLRGARFHGGVDIVAGAGDAGRLARERRGRLRRLARRRLGQRGHGRPRRRRALARRAPLARRRPRRRPRAHRPAARARRQRPATPPARTSISRCGSAERTSIR